MLDYQATMVMGASRYGDILAGLSRRGWPAIFTQTGGMNAALEIPLEGGGCHLLVTDAEDALSWHRCDQLGWGVGFYAHQERYPSMTDLDVALAFESSEDNGIEILLTLVEQVAREGSRELRRRLR